MMTVNNKYDIGEMVYIKSDQEATPYVIIAIRIEGRSPHVVRYELNCVKDTQFVYDFEICPNKWETAGEKIGA